MGVNEGTHLDNESECSGCGRWLDDQLLQRVGDDVRCSECADACPHCKADLRSSPIPDRPGEFYTRTIGVEIAGVYGGCLFWRCPECGENWHRFPVGHDLRALAAPYVGAE